jgi:hypothetical protein
MLSWKPRFEAQCPPHSLTILAKVPADDAARQDSTRKTIGALAAKHPEIRTQAIASFRIDDTQYFAQRWREPDERRTTQGRTELDLRSAIHSTLHRD